jgi:hypothetical protein
VPPPRGGAARALCKRGYDGHSGWQGAREGTVGGIARQGGPKAGAAACTCGAFCAFAVVEAGLGRVVWNGAISWLG